MARPIPEKELEEIERVVQEALGALTAAEILGRLEKRPPQRTLQYRLKILVDADRLVKEGERRWARYRLPAAAGRAETERPDEVSIQYQPI